MVLHRVPSSTVGMPRSSKSRPGSAATTKASTWVSRNPSMAFMVVLPSVKCSLTATWKPCGPIVVRRPFSKSTNHGLRKSSITRPMVRVRLLAREEAAWLRR